MLSRLQRLFKHRWAEDGERTMPATTLARLQARIAASEAMHSGEIRLCVEAGLPNSYLLRPDSTPALLRQRALALFGRLRVWDTEHNNGVLIYLCLAERAIELVADRGVNRLVPPGEWEQVVRDLGTALQHGELETGLNAAVDAVGAMLTQHFALSAGQNNPNELPDAPVVR
ncbi:TPM domain-containing protein [Rhodoferax sp.]|uniref:TPM domain-containing protein n=1 Tax=Rhodoferax sp. TaxID=50421 RepID=UPI002ACE0F48|nr:TPM domain-containing protein [Rhodoferax sp.]MDZ7922254.1 TPM domain-containing protein [Rhodoferax sp.]